LKCGEKRSIGKAGGALGNTFEIPTEKKETPKAAVGSIRGVFEAANERRKKKKNHGEGSPTLKVRILGETRKSSPNRKMGGEKGVSGKTGQLKKTNRKEKETFVIGWVGKNEPPC